MARLVRLEPGKAYLGADLFLPRDLVAEGPVISAMTFGFGEDEYVLAREHPYHIEVPCLQSHQSFHQNHISF